MQHESTLWKIEEVAGYLGVPVSAVYKMTSAGTIPHIKLGEPPAVPEDGP